MMAFQRSSVFERAQQNYPTALSSFNIMARLRPRGLPVSLSVGAAKPQMDGMCAKRVNEVAGHCNSFI